MLRPALLALLALPLSACSTVSYLSQAAWGQLSLLSQARPIPDVLADPSTPPEVRRKLQLAQEVRRFALNDLGLPQQKAFTTYVQLNRHSVSWSVVAAPEFSLTLRTWCFPVTGCVSYKGYFNQDAARAEAQKYRAQGEDIDVQAIPAYSTLGYLPDPLLSTTIEQESDVGLVRLLIHELSHAAVYAPSDTPFNESFAMTIEYEGTRRWLAGHGTPEQLGEFQRDLKLEQASTQARADARAQLAQLYAQSISAEQMRVEKAHIFENLRNRLNDALAERGHAGRWGVGRLNNANLGQAGAYANLVPAFQALLSSKNGDISALIQAAKACAKLPREQRAACLSSSP